jgi:hypothetical protein
MRYVSRGTEVTADDTNLFVDFCKNALECLKSLYSTYRDRTGETIKDVETWLGMADTKVWSMRYMRTGGVVMPDDHNLVLDCLKLLELAASELCRRVSCTQ